MKAWARVAVVTWVALVLVLCPLSAYASSAGSGKTTSHPCCPKAPSSKAYISPDCPLCSFVDTSASPDSIPVMASAMSIDWMPALASAIDGASFAIVTYSPPPISTYQPLRI